MKSEPKPIPKTRTVMIPNKAYASGVNLVNSPVSLPAEPWNVEPQEKNE